MKTVNNQTEIQPRRTRFQYDPSRHYVLVQKPDTHWDGPQFDHMMDEIDADGNDAYRVEADGENGASDRRITGHRQMVMLSCPKEHIMSQVRTNAELSHSRATNVAAVDEGVDESVKFLNAISIEDVPSKK